MQDELAQVLRASHSAWRGDAFVNAVLHPPSPNESARKAAHDQAAFFVEILDAYLKKQADQDLKKHVVVTLVLTPDGATVAACYTGYNWTKNLTRFRWQEQERPTLYEQV